MSEKYEVSEQAITDMQEIWTYIARDSEEAASRMIDRFVTEFAALADMPGMGRVRADLALNLRSISVGSYLIFYEAESEDIRIIRVLHGSRNIRRIFRQSRRRT